MDCKLAEYEPNGVENTDVDRLPPKVDHLTLHTNDDQIPSSNAKQTKNAYSMDADTVGIKEVFVRPPVTKSSAQVQFGDARSGLVCHWIYRFRS